MIQMTFGFEGIEALERVRFTHFHPFVRREMEALFLKSQPLPPQAIFQLCRICGNTLRSCLDEYQIRRSKRSIERECLNPVCGKPKRDSV